MTNLVVRSFQDLALVASVLRQAYSTCSCLCEETFAFLVSTRQTPRKLDRFVQTESFKGLTAVQALVRSTSHSDAREQKRKTVSATAYNILQLVILQNSGCGCRAACGDGYT